MMIARRRKKGLSANVWPALIAGAALCVLAGSAPAQEKADAPVVPPDNGAHVAVTPRGTVELHVADLPLSTVLQMLSLESRRNIVTSESVQAGQKKVTANLYNLSFDDTLDAILFAYGAKHRQIGEVVFVYTPDETGPNSEVRVFWLNHVSAGDVESGLKVIIGEKKLKIWANTTKSDESGVKVSNTTITATTSTNAGTGTNTTEPRLRGYEARKREFIVVKADPQTLEQIEQYLREIDVKLDYALPRQVLVEATILRAQLSNDNALGIDFTIVGGVDLEEMGAVSNGIKNVALGTLPQNRWEKFNAVSSTDFTKNVPEGGVTVGIIKDKVGAFLRALEDVTDTTVLANPKLLALDGQEAQVLVGRRDGYLTTTITETQSVQTIKFLETGTQLVFRPTICKDGYVQIQLNPKDSVGFVNAQGLPTEQTTETTTSVLVRDGQTILIGGLFREVTTDAKSQVPGLGSIPWVGQLFRSNNDSNSREEVIILLTVHIVKDQEAYSAASKEQYENIERMRVGMRQGLMWHGRDRLAQTHYQKALTALDTNDRDKALWHVKMALNAAPRLLPAIELKEKILGERAWYDDGTSGRNFLYRLIAQEKGYPLQPFGRPGADAVQGASP